MLSGLLQFLFGTIASLLGALLLLRAWLYYWAMSPRHPLAMLCRRFTDWLVNPIMRVVKPKGAADWPALIAAFLVAVLAVLMHRTIGHLPATPIGLLIAPFAMLVRWAAEMVSWGAVIWCVLSWVTPQHPMSYTLGTLLDPFLRPIRRIVPTIRNIDLSPMILILLTYVVLVLVTPFSRGFVLM